ncbi:MAG: hypothetical protein IK078_06290 [Lachnospiraceae bacterium]|nr:hypothetical protein [Lachnospiraceae bacterium]
MPDPKKTIKNKIRETYDMQRNTPDQIWVAMLEDAREGVRPALEEMSRDERTKAGLPAPGEVYEEESNGLLTEVSDALESGLSNAQSGKNIMHYLAYVYAQLAIELGKEEKKLEDTFPKEEEKKDLKAHYLMDKAPGPAARMAVSYNKLKAQIDSCLQNRMDHGREYQEEFDRTVEQIRGNLSPDEQKGFLMGEKLLKKKDIGQEEEKKIENWIADKGRQMADSLAKKNIKVCYKGFTKLATSKNYVWNATTPGVNEYLEKNREKDINYLSAVAEELESTGGGKNWDKVLGVHWNNSKEYEKMLASIKAYDKAVREQTAGEATTLRQSMVYSCLAYITGKERVRTHEFGRKRFDAVMTILHKQLGEDDFQRLLDGINEKRKVKEGHADYLDAGKYADSLERYQQRGNEIRQEATGRYATKLPASYLYRMEAIDAVYGIKPKYLPNFYIENKESKTKIVSFTKDEFGQLTSYEDQQFHAIGGAGSLSSKDFSAIAFASALSPEAIRQIMQVKDYKGNVMPDDAAAECFGSMHTIDLAMDQHPREQIGTKVAAMQYGRQQAKKAMEDYAAGDKRALAKILAVGIKNLVGDEKEAAGLSDTLLAKAEMTKRMLGMLQRDPELKSLAMSQENGLTDQDLRYVKSMERAAAIYGAGMRAEERIKSAKNGDITLSDADKKKILTDILIRDRLHGAIKTEVDRADENPEHQNRLMEFMSEYADKMRELDTKREKGEMTMEEYRAISQPAGNIVAYRQMKLRSQYKKMPHLYETLHRTDTQDELKKYAKDKLKDVDVSRLSPAQLLKAAADLAAGKPVAGAQPQRGAAMVHAK